MAASTSERTDYETNWYIFLFNQGGFTMFAFVHAMFLALIGIYDSYLIFTYLQAIDDRNGSMKPMTNLEGLKALCFGIMLGSAGYLAGTSLANKSATILQLIGLNGFSSNTNMLSTTKTIATD